jgi:fucose permease
MAVGTGLVAAAPALLVTLAGALVLGLGGGVVIVTVGAALTSEHPRALLEGNVVASAMGVLAPLLVAGAIALGVGWEVGFGVAIGWIALLAVRFGRARLGAAETGETAHGRAPLPRLYWRRWAVILGVVGSEFALVFWAGSFLREEAGLGAAGAVAGAAAFNGAMFAGRIVGSRLTVAVRAPERLLRLGLLLGLAGALLFVLGSAPALNLLGLVVAGLGAANTFPAAYAFALAAAPGRSDQASARVLLGSGIAILISPLALGALGDVIGLAGAVAIIPALIVATLLLTLAGEGRGLASKGHVGSHAH